MNNITKTALLISASTLFLAANSVNAIPIAAIIATAQQLQPIINSLNTDRSVVLEVDNNTNLTLNRIATHHSHGGFSVPPKSKIPPKTAEVFGSQKKGGALFTGTEGTVTYSGNGFNLVVYWDNPYAGKNKCRATLSGAMAVKYRAVATCGSGNTKAHMRYELFRL